MRQVNHLNGSMNMAQTLLAVFIFTLPFALPLGDSKMIQESDAIKKLKVE